MNNNETEIQIDLLALLNHLRKKIWIIAAVTVVAAVLGLIFSMFFITPMYKASTRLYVLNRSNENNVVSSDFQISNYMINDYKELIKGRNVTHEVITQLGLPMSDAALSQMITVSSPSDTRILHVDVEDSDPVRAQQIANTVREVTSSQLLEIMKVDSVTTVYEAIIPQNPVSPNVMRNTMLAAVLGLVAVIGVYAVIFILDDRIHSEDDVERYLGLSVMGVIPDVEKLTESGKGAEKKKKKAKLWQQA